MDGEMELNWKKKDELSQFKLHQQKNILQFLKPP